MSGRERDDTGHDDDAPIPGLAGLRVDAEPQRDLWPDIAARIAPPRRRMSAIISHVTVNGTLWKPLPTLDSRPVIRRRMSDCGSSGRNADTAVIGVAIAERRVK